ncbi:hypothetical protein KFE94_09700 [bacterium SCSIO 12643]|nr:hypothetical protein KFE94_09700 [bacterium SCSIO 12643]
MKKIATFILIAVGLVLLVLNYSESDTATNPISSTIQTSIDNTKLTPEVEEDDKSIDLSKINLPTIFDALFKIR